MSGYKRIISYIYAYEKGERKENAGFIKLQDRNGECRIAIHLRGFYLHGQKPYQAYLYAKQQECLQGVLLGELENSNGALEWKGSLYADTWKQMPYALEEMRGIWIGDFKGRVYAADWDDYPVQVEHFQVYQRPALPEAEPEAEAKVEAVPKAEAEARIETRPEREVEPDHRNSGDEGEPSLEAAEVTCLKAAACAEDTEQKNVTQLQKQQEDSQIQAQEGRRIDSQPQLQEQQKVSIDTAGDMADVRLEKWNYLSSRFPVRQLFQSGRGPMSCIRIGPRDLQRLPRGSWVLGNNSFLLHGYYQYRHLLLCRQEQEGGAEYYLGVPGVYNQKEQMMAELFGFEEFRRSGSAGNQSGNFGYWFRKIEEA